MTITYILQLGWLLIFAFLVITTLIFSIFWGMCSHPRVQSLDQCIDFTQFGESVVDIENSKVFKIIIKRFKIIDFIFFNPKHRFSIFTDFMFPNNTRVEDMKVCGAQEVKLFCKDYVEKAEVMFILATVASLLVVLSLIHYLMCLSANYAHIRDHEKFQELQELQYLQDPEIDTHQQPMGSGHSKNRY